MAEHIEREALSKYYVVRDKNTGLYFRGKGVNRWGKYYNQASIYRIKANAENAVKEVSWRGEQAEVVEIRIVETTADVVEVRHGEWEEYFMYDCWHYDCPFCDDGYSTKGREKHPANYCSNCGAKLDGKGEGE